MGQYSYFENVMNS